MQETKAVSRRAAELAEKNLHRDIDLIDIGFKCANCASSNYRVTSGYNLAFILDFGSWTQAAGGEL
jgi:hypothetical protein